MHMELVFYLPIFSEENKKFDMTRITAHNHTNSIWGFTSIHNVYNRYLFLCIFDSTSQAMQMVKRHAAQVKLLRK